MISLGKRDQRQVNASISQVHQLSTHFQHNVEEPSLARTSFVLNNPDTYATAYAHLARAVSLVPSTSESCSLSPASLANYVRCIAGVYYYLAGQLQQSGRYDHTVRFLEEACRLGQQALAMHRTGAENMDVDGESKGKEESWKALEAQLYRRWELLGVCHAKTGDRKVNVHCSS